MLKKGSKLQRVGEINILSKLEYRGEKVFPSFIAKSSFLH
jgi:hypothetical protein